MESIFFSAFKKNWPVLLLLVYVVYEVRAVRTEMTHLGHKFESYKQNTNSKLDWLRDDQKEIRAELKTNRNSVGQALPTTRR